eukprot:COSAG05_NODE_1106_length_5866_cov_2.199584_3_plen_64_part_00
MCACRGCSYQHLQPLAEAWSGVDLDISTVYGLRVYVNGSTMTSHTDMSTTHVISAIVHVRTAT